MRTAPLALSLAAILLGAACAHAQGPSDRQERPAPQGEGAGYDARLSGYDYPFPVSLFPVEAQRQQLEMAWMDVQPERPNGRTVVLLHGKNFSGAYWDRTARSLAAQGYRVVIPDQIGFGKSSKPERFQFTFQQLAHATAALLDEQGIARFVVVGHSMGGMLATRLALMYPERVEALVLANPIGLEDWKAEGVPWRTVDDFFASELQTTAEGVRAYMERSYFDNQWKPAYDELIEIQVGWLQGPEWEQVAWNNALTYDMIFTQPVLYEFGDVQAPTLLVIGQRDRTALAGWAPEAVRERLGDYPTLGRRAAAAIPDARLVELQGIGHIPQFEDFDAWNEALLTFLDEVGEQGTNSSTD